MSDTDISSLDACSGQQLRDLLELASSEAKVTLNSLVEVGDSEQLEYLLTEMKADGLLQAICSPRTPLEALVAIKSTAKQLTVAAEAPAQKAAATLLYHLSVASALAHHGQNISSKEPVERLALYKELAAELPDDDLAAIFEKAVATLA